MADKLYFAYGSNINLEQMDYRCPDATVVGPVVLENYELLFFAEVVLPLSLPRREDESMAFCGASRRSASDPWTFMRGIPAFTISRP